MITSAPSRRPLSRILILGGICIASLAATTNPAPAGNGVDWQALLSNKAFACGAAAVVVFIISLLLRGFLKLLSLAMVILLAAAAYWFFRDAPERHSELIPQEWVAHSHRILHLPKARDAWNSLLTDLSHLSHDARARLAAGADDARRSLLTKLDAKIADLKKSGQTSEAAELQALRDAIAKER